MGQISSQFSILNATPSIFFYLLYFILPNPTLINPYLPQNIILLAQLSLPNLLIRLPFIFILFVYVLHINLNRLVCMHFLSKPSLQSSQNSFINLIFAPKKIRVIITSTVNNKNTKKYANIFCEGLFGGK